jgi:hypothetical protein
LLSSYKKEQCKCGKNIPCRIFFQFMSPVLNRLLAAAGFKFKLITLNDVIVKRRSSPVSVTYLKEDLQAIRVEWEWKGISDREFLDAELRRWAKPYHAHFPGFDSSITRTEGKDAKICEREEVQSDIEDWMRRKMKKRDDSQLLVLD